MKARGGTALGVFSALTAAAALIGARVMQRRPRKLWYRLLAKPPQTPPDIAFGIVWPVLYASIA